MKYLYRLSFVLPYLPDSLFYSGFTDDPKTLRSDADVLAMSGAHVAVLTIGIDHQVISSTPLSIFNWEMAS